jgi:uncharacterized protein (TIGR02996 family)
VLLEVAMPTAAVQFLTSIAAHPELATHNPRALQYGFGAMSVDQDLNAYLQAIVARPGDGLPRLVFADWLGERGLTKGEAGQRWAARLEKAPFRGDSFSGWMNADADYDPQYERRLPPSEATHQIPPALPGFLFDKVQAVVWRAGLGLHPRTPLAAEASFLLACSLVDWDEGGNPRPRVRLPEGNAELESWDVDQFLRAILDNAYDASPRLRLADWLDERGRLSEALGQRCLAETGRCGRERVNGVFFPGQTIECGDLEMPAEQDFLRGCSGYSPEELYLILHRILRPRGLTRPPGFGAVFDEQGFALFLQVITNPNDALRRLRFADWLEAHGHPGEACGQRRIAGRGEGAAKWAFDALRPQHRTRSLPGWTPEVAEWAFVLACSDHTPEELSAVF